MHFSRTIFPVALLILVSFCGSSYADSYMYIPEHKDNVITDSQGRLFLQDVPNVDLSQVWFVTGNSYPEEKKPKCLRGRDLWLFSKPTRSSDGVWRGKKAYVTQEPSSPCGSQVNTSPINLDIDTATFSDPNDLHPEEAWDGAVPGIFQVYNGITDSELMKLKAVISQVHACVKGEKCPYPISYGWKWHTKNYDLTPAINSKQLLTMSIQNDYKTGKPCYSMVFAQDNPWDLAVGMSVCFRNEAVSKVELDDEIIE